MACKYCDKKLADWYWRYLAEKELRQKGIIKDFVEPQIIYKEPMNPELLKIDTQGI